MPRNEVHCPSCNGNVVPKLKGTCPLIAEIGDEGQFQHGLCSLFQCPNCSQPIVEIQSDQIVNEEGDQEPLVVWPPPPFSSLVNETQAIPDDIRAVLLEAERSFQHRLYNAFAMLSGRLVELICIERGADPKSPFVGELRRLQKAGTVDKPIADGMKSVYKLRNDAVHGPLEEILPEMAVQARELLLWLVTQIYHVGKPVIPQWKSRRRYISERVEPSPLAERATVYCRRGPLDKLSIVKSVLDELSFPGTYHYQANMAVGEAGNWKPLFVWTDQEQYDRTLVPSLIETIQFNYAKLIKSIRTGGTQNRQKDIAEYELQRDRLLERFAQHAEEATERA